MQELPKVSLNPRKRILKTRDTHPSLIVKSSIQSPSTKEGCGREVVSPPPFSRMKSVGFTRNEQKISFLYNQNEWPKAIRSKIHKRISSFSLLFYVTWSLELVSTTLAHFLYFGFGLQSALNSEEMMPKSDVKYSTTLYKRNVWAQAIISSGRSSNNTLCQASI